MITFLFLAVTLILFVIGVLVISLLRTSKQKVNTGIHTEREHQNIRSSKQRLTELKQQLHKNVINQQQFDGLKAELEYTLASDIDKEKHSNMQASSSNTNRIVIGIVCVFTPLFTVAVYLMTGQPNAITTQESLKSASQKKQKNVDELILGIENRLQQNPEEPQGWKLLAKTYLALGKYQQSIDANLKVIALQQDNADTYVQLADATALQTNGKIDDTALRYIQTALRMNQQHPQALWLAGLAEAQVGKPSQAREYWNRLLPLLKDVPQQQQELQAIIDSTHVVNAPINSTDLSNKQHTDSTIKTTNDPIKSIEIKVTISEEIQSSVTPKETVFVIAKAKNGPNAPLAVKRFMVQDLPIQTKLTDLDAMIEELSISKFKNVVIQARISKSGNPLAQAGDFQSDTIHVDTNQKIHSLQIKHPIN